MSVEALRRVNANMVGGEQEAERKEMRPERKEGSRLGRESEAILRSLYFFQVQWKSVSWGLKRCDIVLSAIDALSVSWRKTIIREREYKELNNYSQHKGREV